MSESLSMYDVLSDLGYENISVFVARYPHLFQLHSQSIVSLLPSSMSSSVTVSQETQHLYEDVLRSDPNTSFAAHNEPPKHIFDSPLSINRGNTAFGSIGSVNAKVVYDENATDLQRTESNSVVAQFEKLPLVKLQSICRSCDIVPKGTKRKLVELLIQKGVDLTQHVSDS